MTMRRRLLRDRSKSNVDGRRLIERVHDESGCDIVQLDVLSANDAAMRFYERLGFAPWAVTLRRACQ